MSKGIRIAFHWLYVLFIALVFPRWGVSQPMPEKLNMEWLLSQPKYRNIHYDSFCRADNESEIGNNALPNRPNVLAYKTIKAGNIRVGIQNNCATNFNQSSKVGRCIKYLKTDCELFHITAIRQDEGDNDLKIAFFIQDINNFYFAKLSSHRLEVFRFKDGRVKRIYKALAGGKKLELLIDKNNYTLSVDGVKYKKKRVGKQWSTNPYLCGLLFDNESVSMIDDFIVDYPDTFEDAGIDSYVEQDLVKEPSFGTYCAEIGTGTANDKITNGSKKSYRFELKKPSQEQVKKNRDNALHSTIMLDGIKAKGGNNFCAKAGGNKPLDSFVLSVDVLFPSTGDEKWELDELFQELIIQEHHVGYGIPFSPSISININKGRLYLNTIWMEHVARGTSFTDNDLHYRGEYVGRINSDKEETYLANKGYDNYNYLPFLERGKWHNITLYVKLGYNTNQRPRTVLYLDSIKVADWNTPNAYNCQEYGEYMEFGVYKWSWDKQEYRDKTPIKKRVIYFDNIHYYI